jgi:uncharacterized protein YeaO (DUF488 family)
LRLSQPQRSRPHFSAAGSTESAYLRVLRRSPPRGLTKQPSWMSVMLKPFASSRNQVERRVRQAPEAWRRWRQESRPALSPPLFGCRQHGVRVSPRLKKVPASRSDQICHAEAIRLLAQSGGAARPTSPRSMETMAARRRAGCLLEYASRPALSPPLFGCRQHGVRVSPRLKKVPAS